MENAFFALPNSMSPLLMDGSDIEKTIGSSEALELLTLWIRLC